MPSPTQSMLTFAILALGLLPSAATHLRSTPTLAEVQQQLEALQAACSVGSKAAVLATSAQFVPTGLSAYFFKGAGRAVKVLREGKRLEWEGMLGTYTENPECSAKLSAQGLSGATQRYRCLLLPASQCAAKDGPGSQAVSTYFQRALSTEEGRRVVFTAILHLMLRPNPELATAVAQLVGDHSADIGVHIRRGDKIQESPEHAYSPIVQYATRVAALATDACSPAAPCNVLVASDAQGVEQELLAALTHIGGRQWQVKASLAGTSTRKLSCPTCTIGFQDGGWQLAVEAVADLMQLTRAKGFVGTYISNLSRLAAAMRCQQDAKGQSLRPSLTAMVATSKERQFADKVAGKTQIWVVYPDMA